MEAQKRLQANLDGVLEVCKAVLTEFSLSTDLPLIGIDSVCCIIVSQDTDGKYVCK